MANDHCACGFRPATDEHMCGVTFAAQKERIIGLRMALYIYGGHVPPCPGRPCECGFQSVWDGAELPGTFGEVMRIMKLNALKPELPSG